MMRCLMMATTALALVSNANAVLITPSSAPQYTGAQGDTANKDAAAISAILGIPGLTELYKQNVGENSDTGTYADSYLTTFANSPSDPADADIIYDGAPDPSMAGIGNLWLFVKDGNHDPSWYLISLVGWNGTETLQLRGFWPNGGSISHVAIYGGGRTSVPDGGTAAMLLGAGLAGLGTARRFMKR